MKVLMFITTADLLLTVLTYIYYRLVFKFARSAVFTFFYVLFSLNVVVSRMLSDRLPLTLLWCESYFSGIWLAVLYYSIWLAFLHLIFFAIFNLLHLRLPHKRFAQGLMAFFFLLSVWGAWRAYHPVVREEIIPTVKLEQGTELKIALVSDWHLGRTLVRGFCWDVVDLINAQNPDVIIIAGDLLDEKLSYVQRANSLEPLSHLHANLGTYMVFGNHDYIDNPQKLQRLLKMMKIKVLQGSNVGIMDGAVKITGLVDFSRDSGTDALRQLAAGNDDFFSILVDHQPRRMVTAQEERYDLYLAGHTHTGQLWPNRIFTSYMYDLDHGRKQYGNMVGIVTSGIGFWGPPIRSSEAPEIVIIKVQGLKEIKNAENSAMLQ